MLHGLTSVKHLCAWVDTWFHFKSKHLLRVSSTSNTKLKLAGFPKISEDFLNFSYNIFDNSDETTSVVLEKLFCGLARLVWQILFCPQYMSQFPKHKMREHCWMCDISSSAKIEFRQRIWLMIHKFIQTKVQTEKVSSHGAVENTSVYGWRFEQSILNIFFFNTVVVSS